MSRTIIQSVLRAQLVELKNCRELQLSEELPMELCRWSMPCHTNQQIIRGSFQFILPDRNQTKWLNFLIDAAAGIKASGGRDEEIVR